MVAASGQTMRFRSDLIGNKAVAINFIYTSCTTICPPLAGIFESVQTQLGDRLGRDIRLVTVSIDPTVDTPQRMARWQPSFTPALMAVGDRFEGRDRHGVEGSGHVHARYREPSAGRHDRRRRIGAVDPALGFSDPEEMASGREAVADRWRLISSCAETEH